MTPDSPFAGRERALARLHQHLIDPHNRYALVFLGQQHSGKTTLLLRFRETVGEGVYISLRVTPFADEATLLRMLYGEARIVLLEAGFNPERVPALPEDATNLREWLKETALPRLHQGLRGGRHLVFLLDDADHLIDALDSGRLPADTPVYLQSLLHPRIDIVLTLDTDTEDRLHRLTPLVNPPDAYRLHYLDREEVQALYAGPDLQIVQTLAENVYYLTGGHPALTQRLRDLLWERTGSRVIALDDLQAVTPEIYTESAVFYLELWQGLSLNERLVLTALAGLFYTDPLKSVTPEQLEAWLVETDFRLDLTAIHAAVRSLEYREMVSHQGEGIVLNAQLLQKWLLENARLDPAPTITSRSEVFAPIPAPLSLDQHRVLWIAIGAAVLLFVLVVLAVVLNSAPITPGLEIIPTVTLGSDATATP